ncbi:hypothetical protein SAMN02990966_05012 [Rhodospirillales bacterium URHD0017]|nr:hypothetical protein SAMN02990966_05012 [Rhodospirillales bacterium URHD0017]
MESPRGARCSTSDLTCLVSTSSPPADAEVPGFRMNADGSVRTDGAAMGRSPSYIPVGWTPPNADDYGNAEIALSNSAGQPAEAAKAAGEGAYSLGPGLVNYARAMGRGLGLYGPEEVQRFYREMDASGLGMRFIAKNPELSAQIAREGAVRALKTQPMLPFRLGGRAGAGVLLGLAGLPWLPPLAMFGDAFRALENGDDFISALGRGIAGTSSR